MRGVTIVMIPAATTPHERSQALLVVTPTPIRIAEITQPRIKRTARETMVNCEVDEVVPVVWRAVLPLPATIVNALYSTNIQRSRALTQGVLLMCILGRVSSGRLY